MDVRKAQIAALVAGDKFVVFLPIFEQRLPRHDVVAALAVPDFGDDLFHGCPVRVLRVQRRAQRHETGSVFGKYRVFFVQLQSPLERPAQRFEEIQGTSQKQHFALDPPPLRQSCHRLVDDRLENGRRDVRLRRALVEKGLDVRLGKHAAAGGDGIGLFRLHGERVHLVHGDVEEGRHLVDERSRAPRAAAVHALFGAARDEDDLRVFAAEFHGDIRVGIVFADGDERRLHLLYKGDPALLGEPQPRAARNRGAETLARKQRPHLFQFREDAFLDARKMPLVTLE